jgi:hypothetical protein
MAMQLGEGGKAAHTGTRGMASWGTKSERQAQQSQLGKVKEITHHTLKKANAKQDLVTDMQSVREINCCMEEITHLKELKT